MSVLRYVAYACCVLTLGIGSAAADEDEGPDPDRFLTVHHFMDTAQLDTPEGRERLQACLFKVPVDGKMISMCEFNGGGRRATEVAELARA